VAPVPAPAPEPEPELEFAEPLIPVVPAPAAEPEPPATPPKTPRARKRKPEVPGWEDVLLGVRSASQP
jgi:hypothetical protein